MLLNDKPTTKIPTNNYNDIYFVADFDKTITSHNSQNSWSVLFRENLLSKEYDEEIKALQNYYNPMLLNNNLSKANIIKFINDWYNKHLQLFNKYHLTEYHINEASKNINEFTLKNGFIEFAQFLYKKNIPLIIISAGISNFIIKFLETKNCYYPNIYVISNTLTFVNGICKFENENVIHPYDKNKVKLSKTIKKKLLGKNEVFLLGDQLSDVKMISPQKQKTAFKIGFISKNINLEKEQNFNHVFNYVCNYDESYENIGNLIFGEEYNK